MCEKIKIMDKNYCEDCGCKVYNGRCVNCHEELYIFDQYLKQGMEIPPIESDFMQKVIEQESEVNKSIKPHN